jgi:hypothetical protein
MTKRLNYYFIMMLMGGIVFLEGSCRFISRIFLDVILLLPPLPASVHYLIRSLLEIAVTYGEVLILLLILSDMVRICAVLLFMCNGKQDEV